MNIFGIINRVIHPQNFPYQYLSLKNMHFFVYPINCCIFANEKSCLTSKRMHIAGNRTIAKSLPQLRWNAHKLFILSYSKYFGRILMTKFLIFYPLSQDKTLNSEWLVMPFVGEGKHFLVATTVAESLDVILTAVER